MSLIRSVPGKLDRFFFTPRNNRALSFTRVALALALALEWLQLSRNLSDLYGPTGLLQANLMSFVDGWTLPALAGNLEDGGISYARLLLAFSTLRWAAIALFFLGRFTRPATVALWLSQVLLMQSGSHSSYGVDRYFLVLLFLFLFVRTRPLLPFRDFLSKVGEKTSDHAFALRYLQLALLIIYVDAGVSKSFGSDWWTGDAVWRALHLPEFRQVDMLWLARVPLMAKLLSWGTMLLETFYIVGIWLPGVGLLWILAMISMHLGIAALLGLTTFGITLAAINVTLFLVPGLEDRRARISSRAEAR